MDVFAPGFDIMTFREQVSKPRASGVHGSAPRGPAE
jgi:hypothetical protein